MKHTILIVVLMSYGFGQDIKVEPLKPATTVESPTEAKLTEVQRLKFELIREKIEKLNMKFRLDEYEKELQALVSERNSLALEACKSLGLDGPTLPQCRAQMNMMDYHPQIQVDQRGNPLPLRIWREKAPEMPATKPAPVDAKQ